jgi:hypothetical protein
MRIATILICFLLSLAISAQDSRTMSGYIRDARNGETLSGVTVKKQGTTMGTAANEYGFYSLTLPAGTHTIVVSIIGYQTYTFAIELTSNVTRNIELSDQDKDLEEVEITAEAADRNVKSTEMSVVKLDIKQINKVPALLGEVDVVRAIQLLPGVTTVGEGASGFNVRGGNIDQNLILLDEAPVYNSSHLFGFFSVFNPDAVKDVKLIKGGIPAQYGGRASSILDVRMKEGNNKKLAVTGGIGTIFSRLSVEAPLIKDKASFIIAMRRSYIDALVKPFLASDNALKNADFYFYDLTAKFNWRIDDKNTLFASGYMGRDVFGVTIFNFDWGNGTATTRWNHIFSKKLFMNVTAFYSNYDYMLKFSTPDKRGFEWTSNIINSSLKQDFTWFHNTRNTMRFGLQALRYDFRPFDATGTFQNATVKYKANKRYGVEYSAYFGNENKLTRDLTIEYGVRFSYYTNIGKATAYYFRDTTPNTEKPLDHEKRFAGGQVIQDYFIPEPRFLANYSLGRTSSIKASYNRMSQFLQLISNTAASTPLDVYTIASNNLRPLIADQGTIGYFRNFHDNMYETSAEVYYKYMQNQLDYIDNANLFINYTVENQLIQGLGRAYGLEMFVRKTRGKLQGWVSYTLSKTERLVRGISNDKWFYSRYDRTHSLNASANYDISKRWNISATFVYLSGVPSTFPNAKVQIQGLNIPYNTDNTRNNFRVTPYHRLDLGATYNFKRNDTHRYKQSLVFSVYNVYNRRNAFSIFFRTSDSDPNQTEAVRFAMIGTIVPAVTYNFNF